jgi:two-component system, NtrC family, nitrogen regulation sensor histidine kinase NtrY
LRLEDAPLFEGETHRGAMAVIRLPYLTPQSKSNASSTQPASEQA